jgi:hypothetical protein
LATGKAQAMKSVLSARLREVARDAGGGLLRSRFARSLKGADGIGAAKSAVLCISTGRVDRSPRLSGKGRFGHDFGQRAVNAVRPGCIVRGLAPRKPCITQRPLMRSPGNLS